MKMNEIIREKRAVKGFTQEQVASALGVSTPAVNKWEKGISYPDITLLPALARLLDTDLNTLMSFQEEISPQELGLFSNELMAAATSEGIDTAIQMARNKIHEFPSCGRLLLNTALTLEGLVSMFADQKADDDDLRFIEALYIQASQSKDIEVQHQAKGMLAAKHKNKGELEEAQRLLDELPDEKAFDKKPLQASIYMEQEQWDKAASIIEQKLLSDAGGIQSALYMLMEIALKASRMEDARKIASVAKEFTNLLNLWEYGAYVADFQYALIRKDSARGVEALKEMLFAMQKPWTIENSPLYRHIPTKEEKDGSLREMIFSKVINDLDNPNNHEYDFLRENPGFRTLMKELRSGNPPES